MQQSPDLSCAVPSWPVSVRNYCLFLKGGGQCLLVPVLVRFKVEFLVLSGCFLLRTVRKDRFWTILCICKVIK